MQVFMALLLNALDAMHEQGAIALRTRAERRRADASIAEVVDQGEGIRRADLPKIFEPFFTTKPPGRGTGLGLSICYAIVTEHGGRIEVDSAPGEGACSASCSRARDETRRRARERVRRSRCSSPRTKRISAQILSNFLRGRGYAVRTVGRRQARRSRRCATKRSTSRCSTS